MGVLIDVGVFMGWGFGGIGCGCIFYYAGCVYSFFFLWELGLLMDVWVLMEMGCRWI